MPGGPIRAEIYFHAYTVQDWIKRMAAQDASLRFLSEMAYDSLINGSLPAACYTYQLTPTDHSVREYSYGYDSMERLAEVQKPGEADYAAYN